MGVHVDLSQALITHERVDLRRDETRMPQELLDDTDIRSRVEEVRSKEWRKVWGEMASESPAACA
jgi:hypothetical protein